MAKFQNFSMAPSLFDLYYLITYSLEFLAEYLKKLRFDVQKYSKISQN